MDANKNEDLMREAVPEDDVSRDLSERGAEVLRESEARYRRLAEATPVLICTFLPDSTLTYVNTAYAEYFQKPPGELLGRRFLEFLPDDGTRDRVVRRYMSLSRDHPSVTYEHPVIGPDGSERWQRWTDRAFFDEEGRIAYFQAVGDDITERKHYEERVNLLSAALESAADATVITDNRGVIEWVNPAFTTLTGYSPEEAIGRNPREILKSGYHDEAFYRGLWTTILAGHTWRGELINRRKDGTLFTEEQTITPVRGARGEIRHFIAIKHDITERKRAEEELKQLRDRFYQAQKMESIGRLAGGIAHDMNNILMPIRGYVDMMLTNSPADTPENAYLREIRRSADRAAELMGKMLAFSRGQVLRREPLDLNEMIRDYERMVKPLIGENINLAVELEDDLMPVNADRGQLEQVIMNLLLNARDAMPDGGEVTIETAGRYVDEGHAVGQEIVYPGQYVILRMRDTGEGMSSETRKRVFEPFFTTREIEKGRGLGLAIVYGIVKQHRGYISVRSEPGKGAVFEVYLLPVTDESVPSSEAVQEDFLLDGEGNA